MITSIALENFKCYRHLDKTPLAQINLLAGLNGRGKSSFMQALLLLAQSYSQKEGISSLKIAGRYVNLGSFKDVLNSDADKVNQIAVSFTTDDKDDNDVSLVFGEDENRITFGKILKLQVGDKDYVVGGPVSANGRESDRRTIGVTSDIMGLRQFLNISYVVADRMGPQNSSKVNDALLMNEIGLHGENLINIISMNHSREDEIAVALSKVMTGASVHTSRSSDGLYLNMLLDSSDRSGGFKPVNVGFGYSYVLPIILTFLLAERGTKIFIENPEAHLHPGAQSRLMDFMVDQALDKDLQLFVETHSDHIINGLRIAVKRGKLKRNQGEILFFDRDNEVGSEPKVTNIHIDSEGNLSDYPDGFMDEWTLQMASLV